MNIPVYIAATDAEAWFWILIVIATIIAQAIKAVRNSSSVPTSEHPGDQRGSFEESGTESVRDIPRRTSQRQSGPLSPSTSVAEAPRKTPGALLHRRSLRPTAQEKAVAPPKVKKGLKMGAAQPTAQPSLSLPSARTITQTRTTRGSGQRVSRAAIIKALREKNSLQQAVVLREILGPTKALARDSY